MARTARKIPVAQLFEAVMEQLESAGTAQNRKIYARHGAAEPLFGVSYAALGKIAKPLKTNHELAKRLWESGVHDARVLALRVADPAAVDPELAHRWLDDVDNYILAEGLGGLCSQSPHARELSDRWRDDPREWVASTGWFIVTCTAEKPDVFAVTELQQFVEQIETEIEQRPNRVRHEMNGAMIAMALREPPHLAPGIVPTDAHPNGKPPTAVAVLRGDILDAARRIGKVKVDHGQTGCKTPDVVPYIERTLKYRINKAKRQAAAKAKRLARANR